VENRTAKILGLYLFPVAFLFLILVAFIPAVTAEYVSDVRCSADPDDCPTSYKTSDDWCLYGSTSCTVTVDQSPGLCTYTEGESKPSCSNYCDGNTWISGGQPDQCTTEGWTCDYTIQDDCTQQDVDGDGSEGSLPACDTDFKEIDCGNSGDGSSCVVSAEADDYRTTTRPITSRNTVIAVETANYRTNVRNCRRNTAADKGYAGMTSAKNSLDSSVSLF